MNLVPELGKAVTSNHQSLKRINECQRIDILPQTLSAPGNHLILKIKF